MIETALLAGFLAAHGVWSVSEGETLTPVLAYEHADGTRGWDRYLQDDIGDAARAAQAELEHNERGAARAVVVVDAYIHSDEGRTDALIVEAVEYGLTPRSMTLAVPYRPLTATSDFTVCRLKFMKLDEAGEADQDALADAFFAGVESHEDAAAVWNAHLDRPA